MDRIICSIFLLIFLLRIAAAAKGNQTSHVQPARSRLRDAITHDADRPHHLANDLSSVRHDLRDRHRAGVRLSGRSRRWSHRRRLGGADFSPWSTWSHCDIHCRQKRERFCTVRRKCRDTRHFEERRCRRCAPRSGQQSISHDDSDYFAIDGAHQKNLLVKIVKKKSPRANATTWDLKSGDIHGQGLMRRLGDIVDDEEDEVFEDEAPNVATRGREKAVINMPTTGRYRRVYSKWSKWSKCTAKCTTRRFKRCRMPEVCGHEVLREVAYCYTEGSFCQEWISAQLHTPSRPPARSAAFAMDPFFSSRRDLNAIATHPTQPPEDHPEFKPQALKCGIPAIRPRRDYWRMLKIIGGRTSRRGQWPWQVAIFNRFKEAFCGGTLISPHWIITAAHCVRKRLYVRLGEHNLEVKDGTEVEYRVEYAIKHPKYDKKTVDNDVAMLKLPREMIPSAFIGFACLPDKHQSLPVGAQCTIIGWGKRRDQDDAGTNVLHEAEVPIITNEECKAVYYDYTITKNMFCAGHKKGRIDSCSGDSGGPILCRDYTKASNPWTIYGITSFGDGCGKRNKFGIYTKILNYVDWIWSVVNCNGVCKHHNAAETRF
ncbi:plasminogen-like [Phlebotomus argentipes]|uniref:plasminogen-like n=1 Tax=Phlebotomus argentipes TaxID=94469 RepID=UPI002892A20E|nr:plasminogen-like [Phlebotomus argentipes]